MIVVTKSDLARAIAHLGYGELFTHETEGTFDVSAMRKLAIDTRREVFKAPIDEDFIKFVRECREVSMERVAELTPFQYKLDPAMAILYKAPGQPDEHILIDGAHRVMRRWQAGYKDMLLWMFPLEEAIRGPADSTEQVTWGKRRVIDGKIV